MNANYTPSLKEQLFVLQKLLDWQVLFDMPKHSHIDSDLATSVLTEAAKFTSEVLSPLNQAGDETGSKLIEGRVITPPGFPQAYRQFVENGWAGLDLPEEYGGQGFPLSIQLAFAEMVNGSCISFGMLPIMLRAASWLLIEHADQDTVNNTVPKLINGEWGATICITEASAGSDVGRLRTRAVPQQDNTYQLTGSKVFISYADHDFTDQIIHLVLARTEGAPAGTQGISLFMVPKVRFDNGEANAVSVSRVERKMGLKASPTCVLDLDGATACRIGPEGQGLKCLFTMVNLMRLEVSIQGVAIADAALQKAACYATERLQGGNPDQDPVPIAEHADVRRMIFLMRSKTEAMRALVYETAFNLDLSRNKPDSDESKNARKLAQFLLPVCKTCGSEIGFEIANMAIQIHGGYGYVSDTGVEQYARDVRVASIYEGTNGIQALDLVTRKLLGDSGGRYGLFVNRVKDDLDRCKQGKDQPGIYQALIDGLDSLERCTEYLMENDKASRRDTEAVATDYLQLTGLVACAWMWLRMIGIIDKNDQRYEAKQSCAEFYAEYVMPEVAVLEKRIKAGSRIIDSLSSGSLFQI